MEKAISKCVVCGNDRECVHSLALKKEKGNWVVNPVCPLCRRSLLQDAKEQGRVIFFYALTVSEKEAEKRNAQKALNRPFLEAFSRPRQEPKKLKAQAG